MRYNNWDVLLFPERSRVPIQEFKTQCCVVGDKGQLPVLTSFIPSLLAQTPFRISIHNWDKPHPSRILESLMLPDDCVLYEVRVYTDNVCVAGSLFSPHTSWPHILAFGSQVDKTGNQEVLRFPQFHPEVIDTYVWEASETHGRLRVIISEGLSRPNRSPPFERVKDIVVFSFQHAPLNILENCGIAWPNPNMWNQLPTNLFRFQLNYGGYGGYGGLGDYEGSKGNDDLHAHSPSRHETSRYEPNRPHGLEGNYHNIIPNVPQWTHKPIIPATAPIQPSTMSLLNFAMDSRINLQPTILGAAPSNHGFMGSDPFIEAGFAQRLRQTQRSVDDISMPDAGPISASSRAMSSVNGMSYEHSHHPSITASLESVDSYHPAKIQTTTTSSTLQTAIPSIPSMPPVSRPSAAAQARSESYSKNASKTSQVDPKELRQISGSSTRSGPTDGVVETIATRKVIISPKGQVKGKKESKGVTKKTSRVEAEPISEPSSREVSKSSTHQANVVVHTTDSVVQVSSETKRKRQTKAPDEASQTSESPTKKLSRVEKGTAHLEKEVQFEEEHSTAEEDDID